MSGERGLFREDFPEERGKLRHPGARHDHGVSPPVGFFGDAQKSAAIILSEFDEEVFAFNLKFS